MVEDQEIQKDIIACVAENYGIHVCLAEKAVQLSNAEVTTLINNVAGNTTAVTKQELLNQLDLIQSELNELRDGIIESDFDEMRDGVADVLFTAYGMATRLGINADFDYRHVCLSNLSKFDTTMEDALLTRDKYNAMDISTEIFEYSITPDVNCSTTLTLYVTKVAIDSVDKQGKFYPKGKWLKSVNFKQPKYYDLQKDNLLYLN